MIIWINGSFGVGKTTIANELHKKIKNSHIYDPEIVGGFIWSMLPSSISRRGDFQDILMWRDFNYQMLKYMNENYSGHIIVPMTLVNKEYYSEIIERLVNEGVDLRHFILLAEKSTILDRLRKRGEQDNSWPVQQVDRCISYFENDIESIKINTDNLSKEETVKFMLETIWK
jgi:deoxyadenosine/deoxycytidine kinase